MNLSGMSPEDARLAVHNICRARLGLGDRELMVALEQACVYARDEKRKSELHFPEIIDPSHVHAALHQIVKRAAESDDPTLRGEATAVLASMVIDSQYAVDPLTIGTPGLVMAGLLLVGGASYSEERGWELGSEADVRDVVEPVLGSPGGVTARE